VDAKNIFFKATFSCFGATQIFHKQSGQTARFCYKRGSSATNSRHVFRPMRSSLGEAITKYTKGKRYCTTGVLISP